uniref:Uncharacterized protein n=1 Tax=Oryza brachyantha TaxID=4533 RepID=J3MGT7_ORYBR
MVSSLPCADRFFSPRSTLASCSVYSRSSSSPACAAAHRSDPDMDRWIDVLFMSEEKLQVCWSISSCVRAWLPVCHSCSPIHGVFGCCGWRARSQACVP